MNSPCQCAARRNLLLLQSHLVQHPLDDIQIRIARTPIAHREPDRPPTAPDCAADVHLASIIDALGQVRPTLLSISSVHGIRKQYNVERDNVLAVLLVQQLVSRVRVEIGGDLSRKGTVSAEDVWCQLDVALGTRSAERS